MNWKNSLFFLLLFALPFTLLHAQQDTGLVQLSGLIIDGSGNQLTPVPYTNVYVKNSNRGTYSNFKGFFSLVIRRGEVVVFSCIGYKTIEFQLPPDHKDDHYSIVQLMTQDAINLPETVVFPWPSRDNFRLEFLAMDVTPELQRYAAANMANEALSKAKEGVAYDGRENASYYMRKQASKPMLLPTKPG